ncbi:hypothetical protein N7G274_007211 [Stereocaulon virgatum]|uniref:Uncharacterized protein n=1 Tax=Stereocaulon virgatum TaxID=373712 RepID=A0ABR4A4D4_9LECA
MASRMKKMFHRKKHDDAEEPQPRTRAPENTRTDPAVRSSLYEDASPAAPPQTGDTPMRGNDSFTVLQQGHNSAVKPSRNLQNPNGHDTLPYQAPTYGTQLLASNVVPGAYDPYQQVPALPKGRHNETSPSALHQDIEGLNLGGEQSPTTVTQSVTTTRVPTGATSGDGPFRDKYSAQGYSNQGNTASRNGNQDAPRQVAYNSLVTQDGYGADLARQKSIPRKQVGISANAPYSSAQSPEPSSEQLGHSRNQSASKPLPVAPASSTDGYDSRRSEAVPQPSGILDRSRPISRGVHGPRDAQEVINRSKNDTYDTLVTEKVAPAVVHETVHRDIHHVREEQITRDIHNHDVYHRILPVIDVEVLPPRHFLPVEGGGLVEISASEVPGRGNNWVIAETASKIPSDQAAPRAARQFTAREFSGREGDSLKYTAPEGHVITEQTWVHPPELETGARDTGQSWPMVFGDDSSENASSHRHTDSKSSKRKSPKKTLAAQASPAQRADVIGRGL